MLKREKKYFNFWKNETTKPLFEKESFFRISKYYYWREKKAVNYSMIFNGDFYYRINELTQ